MLLKEIWKPIKGYEGLYEVSNLGRVKALERKKNCNRGYGIIKEHFLKPNNHGTCGYYRVPLTNREHIRKYFLVHRLVAENFIENPKNLPQINHKDGNKDNNAILTEKDGLLSLIFFAKGEEKNAKSFKRNKKTNGKRTKTILD